MKEKLTKLETRAKDYCALIDKWGSTDFGMEWRRSREWGRIAVITDNRGDKCSEASGCGYDKESACLSGLLGFLCPSAAHKGGVGLRAVKDACLANGWLLEKTASGKTFDGYRITRIEKEGEKEEEK